VLADIERLLGDEPRGEPVTARAAIEQIASDRWQAQIEMSGGNEGQRILTARRCYSLAHAVALIIAIAVDPEAVALATPAPEEPSEPKPVSPARRQPASPPPVHSRPASRLVPDADPPGFVLLQALGEAEFSPSLAPGIATGGGIRSGWLRLEVLLGFVPHSTAAHESMAGAGARFRLGLLDLRSCAGISYARLAAFGCAALRLTRIWVRGTGVPEPRSTSASALALAPGVLVAWTLMERLDVEGGIDGVVAFDRPRFVIENLDGLVHQPPQLGVSARLGVAWRFD
jgi:hypothetical protein